MKDKRHIKRFNEASENLNISDVSNSDLLEHFEDAVCDKNYNPTSDPYNKSGFTYEDLKNEILDRINPAAFSVSGSLPLIEFIEEIEYMMKLYGNKRYAQAGAQRDKLAEKLEDIMRLGGNDR